MSREGLTQHCIRVERRGVHGSWPRQRPVMQEEARKLRTLREVEPLLADAGEGGILAAAVAAAKQHLHEGPYEASEIEDIIGQPLTELYADNQHSQKCGPHTLDGGDVARSLGMKAQCTRLRSVSSIQEDKYGRQAIISRDQAKRPCGTRRL